MTIQKRVEAYHSKIRGAKPSRFRSWEHCYSFFRRTPLQEIARDPKQAALQLGFYLASWGMYRGSSFLLQYDYTAHLGAIEKLIDPAFQPLWEPGIGSREADSELIPLMVQAIEAIRGSYKPFKPSGEATDTLVTKVILGTMGCLPACDRFFIDGFKSAGFRYYCLNSQFLTRIMKFCLDNLDQLRSQQEMILNAGGLRYPLMKLADMYFWQIGYERWEEKEAPEAPEMV